MMGRTGSNGHQTHGLLEMIAATGAERGISGPQPNVQNCCWEVDGWGIVACAYDRLHLEVVSVACIVYHNAVEG